ncbi:MAG: Rrf2 family transcriptional regulator [Candidatus Aegiribacteria sp.]|nr:Rrf2 family transcriptional regulator [Candidatus Aegiribacteria sp.]MBD3295580.1 Rrf2 family transcriptional regulator [Candidatus Fermentibacteria bacterium]
MSSPINIPESFSLAVHGLARLAAADSKPVKLQDLLIRPGSTDHLSKVMQKLVKAGMVRSRRGRGGGFTLAVNPADIRLMDVWIVLEGTFENTICPYAGNGCSLSICLFGSLGQKASGIVRDYLTETTVEDLGSGVTSQFP